MKENYTSCGSMVSKPVAGSLHLRDSACAECPSYCLRFTCDCAVWETTVPMLFIRNRSFSRCIFCALVPISIPQSHLLLFSRSVVSDTLRPHGLKHARLLCPWDSPGKNTGMGCHALLQGIFPAQRSNLGVLHGRQILYHLSHKESP